MGAIYIYFISVNEYDIFKEKNPEGPGIHYNDLRYIVMIDITIYANLKFTGRNYTISCIENKKHEAT